MPFNQQRTNSPVSLVDPTPTDATVQSQDKKAARGEKTAENVRFGEKMSEEGFGGQTVGNEGFAGTGDEQNDGNEEGEKTRRQQGYGGGSGVGA